MADWRSSTWGDEIVLEYGKALRGYSDVSGPYRVFGSNGPAGWTTTPLVDGPGVILGRKGAYRGVRYSAEPFFVIDTAYYVRPKTEIDMRWLYYAIIFHKLGEIDDGSPIPSTTRSAVYVRDVDIPSIGEQRDIASVLAALDDKIELNRRMNETLETMARAIFKDWFVDFGPTRAKMEGRAPYLAPDLWALFPDRLDDEGKPEGWHLTTLSEALTIESGGTPKTSNADYWDGDIPWFSVVDAPDPTDVFVLGTKKHITEAGLENSAATRLRVGSTIITARGTVGKLALVGTPMAMNQSCYAVAGKGGLGDYGTFFAVQNAVAALQVNTHGSVFDTITRQTFHAITTVQSPHSCLQSYETTVAAMMERIRANGLENRTLAATRDLLLPKLMSGEIRVRDAEALIADAA